ncbi:MAG: type II toxin-antitoxin system prevent-host-death family antitoxin [Ignavibacteria bacterium]|nr:type II toxin-antitoxin system prevent-host-death family antitoxin [Ignavibacteria bacterium]
MKNLLALYGYGHVDLQMTINVTDFKARCLELLRELEETGVPITLTRRNMTIAVIYPSESISSPQKPWQRLQGTGTLLATADESVLSDDDFFANQR